MRRQALRMERVDGDHMVDAPIGGIASLFIEFCQTSLGILLRNDGNPCHCWSVLTVCGRCWAWVRYPSLLDPTCIFNATSVDSYDEEEMTDLTPLILEPVIVAKPWGGRRLASFAKPLPEDGEYGESWEVADLPADPPSGTASVRSPIANGVHAGTTLRSLIETYGPQLLGSAPTTASGDFPLLVKLLDAHEPLSVQVHPTREYVAVHPESRLKTESWYVIEADSGAVIYKGFKPGVRDGDVRSAAGTQAFVELVQDVPAVRGEFHHLPAGIIHALGAGVLVAETQTPSDTTFRMYDWTEEYGRTPRTLHIEEGLETIDMDPIGAVALYPMEEEGDRLLIVTDHYWQREHRVADGPVRLRPGRELRVVMVVCGCASVSGPGRTMTDIPKGTTVVIPAVIAEAVTVEVSGKATVLETGLV